MCRRLLNAGLCAAGTVLSGAVHAAGEIDDPAAGWDRLWNEMLIDITVIGVFFALVAAYFLVRYRRRRPEDEGNPPLLTRGTALGWALIPAFLFMADDFFLAARSWQLWNDYRTVPEDHFEVKLESAMWSWTYTYPNGVKAVNELRVPAGKPVVLRMRSKDVVHSHFIPDFRIKEDSMPGRITYMMFYPKQSGEHVVTCAEYCGLMHSRMSGKLIVMAPEEFAKWYEAEAAKLAAAADEIEKGGMTNG